MTNLSKKSKRKFIRVFEDIELSDNIFCNESSDNKPGDSNLNKNKPNNKLNNKGMIDNRLTGNRSYFRNEISLNDKNSHYLLRVMRRKIGDYIRVFNGQHEWIAKLVSVSNRIAKVELIEMMMNVGQSVDFSILENVSGDRNIEGNVKGNAVNSDVSNGVAEIGDGIEEKESEGIYIDGDLKKNILKNDCSKKDILKIGVILCPIKSNRFATVIEKITEIGVNEIFFVRSKNTIISEVNIYKVKCWIEEAMKQSNGLIFPKLPQLQICEALSNMHEVSQMRKLCQSAQTQPYQQNSQSEISISREVASNIFPISPHTKKNDNDQKLCISSIKQFFNYYFMHFTNTDYENVLYSSAKNELEQKNKPDNLTVVIILDKGHDNILNALNILKKNALNSNDVVALKAKSGYYVNSVYIMAGPEGGFSREEKKYFDELSYDLVYGLSDDLENNELSREKNLFKRNTENISKKVKYGPKNGRENGSKNGAKIKILFASMGNTNLRSETATIIALGIVKNFFDSAS